MAKQLINIGVAPDDNLGDPLRTAFSKANDNFNELYQDSYTSTIYVDPNGDATTTGKNPALPTTLANALATVPFGGCIMLAEGTHSTGSTIIIPQSNLTISTIQGGTGSNSTIISDDIDIPAGVTRLKCHGIQFDGAIIDTSSDGRHYFSWCSLGATGSFVRNNPNRWCELSNCDFSLGSLDITGTGVAGTTTTLTGSSSKTPLTYSIATNHKIFISNNALFGGVTLINGKLRIEESLVLGISNCINASVGTTVELINTEVFDVADGVSAQRITLAGDYELLNTVFDKPNSTLTGTPLKTNSAHWTSPIQAQNHKFSMDFIKEGDWTIGNYLLIQNGSIWYERLIQDKIEIFEIIYNNGLTLSASTDFEIIKNPTTTATVLATVAFDGNFGSKLTLPTPIEMNAGETLAIRLKTETETPWHTVMNVIYRILD